MTTEDQNMSGEDETTKESLTNSPETDQSAVDEELERYGVWVKVEPQDLEETEAGEDLELQSLDGEEELPDASLTEEEEELLGDLESDLDSDVSAIQLEQPEVPPEEDDDFSLSNTNDTLNADLDEISIDEIQETDLDELSVDTLETPEISSNDAPTLEIGENLEAFEVSEEEVLGDDGIEDIISVDSNSAESVLPDIDYEDELPEIEDLSDIDDFADNSDVAEEISEPNESEASLIDGGTELESADPVLPGAEEELEDFDMEDLAQSDFGEELTELEAEDDLSEIDISGGFSDEPELETIGTDEEPAGNLRSVEEELMSQEVEIKDSPTSGTPEILHNIEGELKSIKEELMALKQELSSLKGVPHETASEAREIEEEGPEGEPGFFEEEDDETIALTGDELDNILNTADITEETVEAAEAPDDTDLLEMEDITEDKLVDQEDIIPLDADVENLTLEEENDIDTADAPLENDLDEDDEISLEKMESDVDSAVEDFDTDDLVSDLDDLDLSDTETLEIEEPESLETDLEELDLSSPDAFSAEVSESTEPDLEDLDLSGTDTLEIEEIEADSSDLEELDLSDELEIEEPAIDPAEEETLDLVEEAEALTEDSEIELEEIEELEEAEELGSIDLDIGEPEIDEVGELEEDLLSDEVILKDTMDSEPQMGEAEELIAEELGDLRGGEATSEGIERADIPEDLKNELKSVLQYMDHLLESLPEEKIQEFAQSEHFEVYKKLFEQLGLEE